LPLRYKDVLLDCGYRLDFLIDSKVIVELKSVDQLVPIHTAQLMTYLRLTGCQVGLLMNFNVEKLRDGIVRRVI
jgi:GxxExxY protein